MVEAAADSTKQDRNKPEFSELPMLDCIPNIDIEVTGLCNLRCPGCWGTPRMMPMTRSFDDLFAILDRLKKNGLKSVTLCGGEPTLAKGIDDFIVRVHSELNLDVYLQTNGFFLIPLLGKIGPHLHTVSLSLEGSTAQVNAFRRGPDAFAKAIGCLQYLDKNYPEINVKIGTCVFRQNIADMPSMGEMLLRNEFGFRYPDRGVWKLYQITRFGAGRDDALLDSMLVSDSEFNAMAERVKHKFARKISITTIATKEMGGYCIILRPDGKVVSNGHDPEGKETVVFSDFFADVEGGIKAIIKFQNRDHVKNRLEQTYRFRWENETVKPPLISERPRNVP